MNKFLLALLVLFMNSAFSLVSQTIDTSSPIKVCFSKSHMNRISVNGGKIKKIIAPQELFAIRADKDSGQAFVTVLGTDSQYPAYISVITSEGKVQDLEISIADKPAELVILKNIIYPNHSSQKKSSCLDNSVSSVRDLMKGCLPPGYAWKNVKDINPRWNAKRQIRITPISLAEGPYEYIAIYEVVNRSRAKIRIQESEFEIVGDKWIFFSKTSLDPKAKTLCFISMEK